MSELKPEIEGLYRTRSFSILVGHSYGGLLATHAMVNRPDAFDATIAVSPSLWWDGQRVVAQADSTLADSPDRVGSFYMTMSNECCDMAGGALKMAGVLTERAPEGFRWHYGRMEDDDHFSSPLKALYSGLEWVFDGWTLRDPMALYEEGGLASLDRYFRRITERFRDERRIPLSTLLQIGGTEMENGNTPAAAAAFERIVARDPNSVGAHVGLAQVARIQGNAERAIVEYLAVLREDPRNGAVRDSLEASGFDTTPYPARVDVSPEILRGYVGPYRSSLLIMEVALVDSTLFIDIYGRHELYPVAEDRFRMVDGAWVIEFDKLADGSSPGFTLDWGERLIRAARVE